MVNIKVPAFPVQKLGFWPPPHYRLEYIVKDTDNWWTVADRFNVDVWDLIEFNFQTRVPEEVNWYLRELVGCRLPGRRGKNYSFRGADPSKRKIYIPYGKKSQKSPQSPKKALEEVLEALELEIEASNDPRRQRYLCMIDKLERGVDDRVIFWYDIAPDQQTPVPVGIVKRRTRLLQGVDPQWLFKTIKDWRDVDRQPVIETYAPGTPPRMFVTSLSKVIQKPFKADLFVFRWMHDQIVETHSTLEKWSSVGIGGSSSVPREYRAIKEWVRQQSAKPNTVLNCVISSGT